MTINEIVKQYNINYANFRQIYGIELDFIIPLFERFMEKYDLVTTLDEEPVKEKFLKLFI